MFEQLIGESAAEIVDMNIGDFCKCMDELHCVFKPCSQRFDIGAPFAGALDEIALIAVNDELVPVFPAPSLTDGWMRRKHIPVIDIAGDCFEFQAVDPRLCGMNRGDENARKRCKRRDALGSGFRFH